jgi:polysaccharide pyruvyl transferase WcaK-like protein
MIDEKRAKSGLPKIQDIYLQAKDYTAQQLLYIFKEHCSFMVSMRLHALILGHIAGLQSTAIAIDPKINEFIHQIDVYKLNILRDRAVKHFDKILFLKLSDNQPNRLKKNIYKKPSLKF